jgi:CBS domain-containing protein
MATVSDVLRTKQQEHRGGAAEGDVATIAPDATVLDAAKAMNHRKIGSLVVTDDGGRVRGIITERDILTRVVAAARDPRATRVSDVMTTPVITCAPGDPLDGLKRLIRERRIRHVPVVNGDRLCGMVSLGDLNAAEVESMSQTIVVLEEYIQRG